MGTISSYRCSRHIHIPWGDGASRGHGIHGVSFADGGRGVLAVSTTSGLGVGVEAKIKGMVGYAVMGTSENSNPDSNGHGVGGFSFGGEGIGVVGVCEEEPEFSEAEKPQVVLRETLKLQVILSLLNADCAEDFDVSDLEAKRVEAGTVMVLTENGSLQSSHQEYDKKVAGIVSGASGYKPAMVLNRQINLKIKIKIKNKNRHRLPIALMGKVYCKVDARNSPIEIGDLLTTSSTKGYAMKAENPMKAFGAVIGKALGSIKEGLGMIPVLVTLQ